MVERPVSIFEGLPRATFYMSFTIYIDAWGTEGEKGEMRGSDREAGHRVR